MSNHQAAVVFEDDLPSSHPPRILHLISTMDPVFGGPVEVVRQLALGANGTGRTMEIVSQDDPSSAFLKSLPCPVHATGSGHTGFGYSKKLLHLLQNNIDRFDGLVIHGVWLYVDVAGASAARGHVPYAVFVHGALDPWFKKQYPLKHIKKSLYWPMQYKLLREATAVLFTGESERDLAASSFRPNSWNSRIIPLGIHSPGGDRRSQIEAFYSLLPQLRSRRYLLFLGRIHEKKGCDLLIAAFAKIASQYPYVDLVMAGPDQVGMQAGLQRLAESAGIAHRVHWPGMLWGDAKAGAHHGSEALILPSHQENFGLAIVESLSHGKPVLTTNKVEIWPILQQENVGLISNDTLDGTEQLLRIWLALETSVRAAMAARARLCFEKHFSIRNTILALDEVFERR
jgi:glycosyltransferase involved in cell wall biosynthesis